MCVLEVLLPNPKYPIMECMDPFGTFGVRGFVFKQVGSSSWILPESCASLVQKYVYLALTSAK